MSQINDCFGLCAQLMVIAKQQNRVVVVDPSSRDRIVGMMQRRKVVAVSDVVRDLGIPDRTARRILDEITPGVARAIPGRPTKWRLAVRIG